MQKKVALFIGSLLEDYQSRVSSAITSNVKGRFNLDVFTNLGEYGDNYLHNEGESNIINLPDLKDYSGIIVAPDSMNLDGQYADLLERLEDEATCPIVSLRYRENNFYNILIDDGTAIAEMIRHFVYVHGCTRIAFMTGRHDLADARRRTESYYATMAECGLNVTEHMVFNGNYWRNKGDEAVEWFLSNPEGPPEAIVCANDYMALSVVAALQKRGYRVPEEIKVSGFDNIDEGRYSDPRIASMDVPFEAMGRAAVELLVKVMNGESCEKDNFVSILPVYEGSCGCYVQTRSDIYHIMYEQNETLTQTILTSTYMSSDYESCLTMEELMTVAFRYSFDFDYENLYFCLSNHPVDEGDEELEAIEQYTDQMRMYCSFTRTDDGPRFDGQLFDRKELLPAEYRRENEALFMFPLHYKNECLGYIVFRTDNPGRLPKYFLLWIQSLAAGMDKVAVINRNKLYQKFREESMLDSLTGLYNRRAFENVLRKFKYGKDKNRLYIMSIDMDGLKMINDTYGHAEGDKAICAFANILKSVEADNVRVARIGGDEFAICLISDDDTSSESVKGRICAGIEQYNRTSSEGFLLSASIGYARMKGNSIMRCLKEADIRMYEEKAGHHNSRTAIENGTMNQQGT